MKLSSSTPVPTQRRHTSLQALKSKTGITQALQAMPTTNEQTEQIVLEQTPPDILALIEHPSPTPARGPYTSLLRHNGEASPPANLPSLVLILGPPEFVWPGSAGASPTTGAENWRLLVSTLSYALPCDNLK